MIPIVNPQHARKPVVAIIVKPNDCYGGEEHILSFNPYNQAIQCERCGQPYILGLQEVAPGKWIREDTLLNDLQRR